MCAGRLPWQSDLAVLQVGVDVLDEGIVRVTDRENQLAEGAASHVALLRLHPEIDRRPGLSVLCRHVPRLRVAGEGVGPLRDGEGRAGCWASHDAAGNCSRGHAQRPRRADGMRAGPLLLIFRGLWGLWGRCGGRRGLKMQVCHLRQRERHLP